MSKHDVYRIYEGERHYLMTIFGTPEQLIALVRLMNETARNTETRYVGRTLDELGIDIGEDVA